MRDGRRRGVFAVACAAALCFVGSSAQEMRFGDRIAIYGKVVEKFTVPDVLGYKVIAGDYHMHTIYSDGVMLPEVMVNLALRDGLGALAITDHLEFAPRLPELPREPGKWNAIARPRAAALDLLYLDGTELTRDFDGVWLSAHFVALGIKDAKALDLPDTFEALREAKRQGAFVVWCHPPAGAWGPSITKAFDEGLFGGIEVYNGGTYFPDALKAAAGKGLAVFGGSDAHDPYFERPLTIAFARDRTEEALLEAFRERRTLVKYGVYLCGDAKLLEALFRASVSVPAGAVKLSAAAPGYLSLVNASSVGFRADFDTSAADFTCAKDVYLEPLKTTKLKLALKKGAKPGMKVVALPLKNPFMSTGDGAILPMSVGFTLKVE